MPITLHHFQCTLKFLTKGKPQDLHTTFLSEIIVTVLYLDPPLENDSFSENLFPHIDHHQDLFPICVCI